MLTTICGFGAIRIIQLVRFGLKWKLFLGGRFPLCAAIPLTMIFRFNASGSLFFIFRILQITDLHVSTAIRKAELQCVVDRANEQKVNLVVFTGDLADDRVLDLRFEVVPLADFKEEFGNFFVAGSHGYYSGLHSWLEEGKRLPCSAYRYDGSLNPVNGYYGRTQIYVSRGTGYWGPPMQVGVPSEIIVLRLVKW